MNDVMARSQTWRLLCTWFSQPDSAIWESALAEGLFNYISPTGGLLPHALDPGDYRFEAGMNMDDLGRAYSSCFEVGNAPVSFHGRTYTDDAASKLFEELFRYYEHFGLNLTDNDNANWPDSILVELEFMYYLCHLESIAGSEDDVLSLQRGQRDFITRHLAPLVEGISKKLSSLEIAPYDQLAKLLKDYVSRDCDYLDGKADGIIARAAI